MSKYVQTQKFPCQPYYRFNWSIVTSSLKDRPSILFTFSLILELIFLFNFSEKYSMFNFSFQTFTWKYVLVQQCFNRWVNFNEDCIFSLNKLILYLNPTLIRLFDIDSLIWERWRLLWCCVKMCVSVTHLMLELWSVAVGMCCSVELFNFAQLL